MGTKREKPNRPGLEQHQRTSPAPRSLLGLRKHLLRNPLPPN